MIKYECTLDDRLCSLSSAGIISLFELDLTL